MINPYEFLGLTVKSSLNDLRKAYYNMSLACHPDKGGSAEAMVTLHTAYKYIKEHLDNVQEQPDSNKTYEELQKEFDDYIKEQDSMKPPSFLNVVAESLDIKPSDYMAIYEEIKPDISDILMYDIMLCCMNEVIRRYIFIERITQEEAIKKVTKEEVLYAVRADLLKYSEKDKLLYSASIPDGYGALMDKSELDDTIKPPTTAFEKQEMILYHEPDRLGGYEIPAGDLPIPQKKDDYTIYESSLPITDYKRAYSEDTLDTASSIFAGMCSEDPINVRLAAKEFERTRLDEIKRPPERVTLEK